ncbi:MAG: hypothetical protein ACFFDD_15280 [Promethearchaeota archaeon]
MPALRLFEILIIEKSDIVAGTRFIPLALQAWFSLRFDTDYDIWFS